MLRTDLDLRCYLVTAAGEPEDIVRTAAAAAHGGAGVVQVRSKPISARALTSLAEKVAYAVADANPRTRVLVDDRVDVALALRNQGVPIHGVHLGQDDLDPRDARDVLGNDAVIGLTTGTLELIHGANELHEVLDYIGCGPLRATPTKDSGRAPIGLDGYPALTAASHVPLVAIGDVQISDVAALAQAGTAGVAIVRGFAQAADPKAYAREVIREFEAGCPEEDSDED